MVYLKMYMGQLVHLLIRKCSIMHAGDRVLGTTLQNTLWNV